MITDVKMAWRYARAAGGSEQGEANSWRCHKRMEKEGRQGD